MEVNIQGEICKMGGVTGVATYPEYTGRGLIHTLIGKSLEYMRSQQQIVSYLCPYSIPLYRKHGWEIVSDKMTFTIKDTQLPKRHPVDGQIERVDIECEDLHRVYKYFALQQHGALIRGKLEWEEYWRWDSDDVMAAVYYSADGKPLGYVIYYIENEVFSVKEMVYLNQEAKDGIWNYISAHFSMPSLRREASRTRAKTSGSSASRVLPSCTCWRYWAMRAGKSASSSFCISGSKALMLCTSGRNLRR